MSTPAIAIDFHILNHRTNNSQNLLNAQLSLVLSQINPTIIHNPGTILEGRKKAYFETDALYYSFVDDDDESRMNTVHIRNMVAQSMRENKPVYSNSQQNSKYGPSLMTGKHVKKWTLEAQKKMQTIPHQTIIYEKNFVRDLFLKGEKLIIEKGWNPNTIDYLMRHLVSKEVGWTYYPEVTYLWKPDHKKGQHVLLRSDHKKIYEYIYSSK